MRLEHSSAETIWMIQNPTVWATGGWQLHHDNVSAHASRLVQMFFEKHQIAQVPQPHYSPDLVLISGKRFQTLSEIQENTRQLMMTGRTVWGSKVPTLKGTESSLSYVQCFLFLRSSSINVSILSSVHTLHIIPHSKFFNLTQNTFTNKPKYYL